MSTRPVGSNQLWIALAIVVMSAANSVLVGLATLRGQAVLDSTEMLWYFVFTALVTLWARNDVAARGAASRDYSNLLMFFFWPVVLPYHLMRTRGSEGMITFLGFLGAYMAPQIVQLYVWAWKAS